MVLLGLTTFFSKHDFCHGFMYYTIVILYHQNGRYIPDFRESLSPFICLLIQVTQHFSRICRQVEP